ncbi:MAG: response regulator [Lyngbya sp. HA4199-MV5]|jgi:CheY-like chemotaxis protein|nr:response regulator [Lyngbya sp. HA4199-MV5]
MNACQIPFLLLAADDNPDDRLLIQEAWQEVSPVELQIVGNGEELMDFLYRRGQYADSTTPSSPNLILLDLNMPRKNGYEALQEIKTAPALKKIPVVVLTTSIAKADIDRSYELGASGHITKPNSFDEFTEQMQALYSYWFKTVNLPAIK